MSSNAQEPRLSIQTVSMSFLFLYFTTLLSLISYFNPYQTVSLLTKVWTRFNTDMDAPPSLGTATRWNSSFIVPRLFTPRISHLVLARRVSLNQRIGLPLFSTIFKPSKWSHTLIRYMGRFQYSLLKCVLRFQLLCFMGGR